MAVNVKSIHITDFGISAVKDDVDVLASTITGTLAFMSPEILQKQKYDPFKSDSLKFCSFMIRYLLFCTVWSFGIVLYEILTFEEPSTPGKFSLTLLL